MCMGCTVINMVAYYTVLWLRNLRCVYTQIGFKVQVVGVHYRVDCGIPVLSNLHWLENALNIEGLDSSNNRTRFCEV